MCQNSPHNEIFQTHICGGLREVHEEDYLCCHSTSTMSTVGDEKKTSIGKSITKASQMVMGVGTPLHKQLKFAIIEGNEEKAISVYNSKEMGKTLKSTLHPSKPFPSKKDPNGETPLHLSAKHALPELFRMFLEFGGRPDIVNSRQETTAHTVCTEPNASENRAEIVDQVMKWRAVNPSTNKPVLVSPDALDIDGNTAMHLAAFNGLLDCIQRLIAYRASSYVLNHSNLTSAEYADVSGKVNIGTMIELAALFSPSTDPSRARTAVSMYRTALAQHKNDGLGVLVLDSHSLTVQGLMKFITKNIALVSEVTKETAARSEALLMEYSWDARRLLEDYERNAGQTLRRANLLPRAGMRGNVDNSRALVVSSGEETAVVLHDSEVNLPVGVDISEVFLDPCYREVAPFTVMRGEKKVSYTVRVVQGKTVVMPFDTDSTPKVHTFDDQNVSASSPLKPEETSPCSMCGEVMLEAASAQHFIADSLVQPLHRELQCGSGHKYCFSCWSGFLQAHAAGQEGLHSLRCPNADCGDCVDLQWASVLLKSPDLVNRVLAQRQRLVTDRLKLHWCSMPKCGLIVHVHAEPGEEARGSDCAAGAIPLCGLCANGHGVCLCCGTEPHSPAKCEDVTKWQDLLREASRTPAAKDRNSPASILLEAPHHKNCPHCGFSNPKDGGSNHIRCTGCFREFCWICQKDWAAHTAAARPSPAEDEDVEEAPFQCNMSMEMGPVQGLSDRLALFLRYFARHQAHTESFNAETAMFKACVDRVAQGLKASKNKELQWLLGDSVANPYAPEGPVTDPKEFALADAYLPREKSTAFLCEAFEELQKCRLLLRWSYTFSMFQFEEEFRKAFGPNGMVLIMGDRSAQRGEFLTAQNALERQVEELSDLLSYRRLRGSKDDIVEAQLAAKAGRIGFETLIVSQNPTFGSASIGGSRGMSQSIDERHGSMSTTKSAQLAGMRVMSSAEEMGGAIRSPVKASSQAPAPAAASSSGKTSSYSAAMDIDVGVRQTQQQQAPPSMPKAPPPAMKAPPAPAPAPAAKAPVVEEPESEEEYGYNSGDDEGLQVCTDITAMKLDASPSKAAMTKPQPPTMVTPGSKVINVTLEGERSTQKAEEVVTTTRTTKVTMVQGSALSGKAGAGSGNSLMSDLTAPDVTSSTNSMQFAKMTKMNSAEVSPVKQATNARPAPPAAMQKTASLSTRQLAKEANKLLSKQIIEHIDEQEEKVVYQLMSKHKITREKAVRMFLEEHDERLYNPKAVYLFPGEEYMPEDEGDDSSEERRKEALFGRVEYNHKVRNENDSISEASPATIEQRLIGAKKDPDQEALEHAMLLSSQEAEFGVNMYDSLTSADQVTLAEYISQGFTREEAALIIFEEKFGKTRSTQGSAVIPAMPTLQAVHAGHGSTTQSHTGTDRSSGQPYGSDEDDDEEVEELIRRGYTREQAIAVIEAHKEKARRAALTQHPTDPTHYYPHPDEEKFNLTENEEREVQAYMSREGFSRRIAVETVVQMRQVSSSASVVSNRSHHSHVSQRSQEETSYSSGYSESAEVRKYMERGYTREQALQLVKKKNTSSNSRTTSSAHVRTPSFTSGTSLAADSGATEESEIAKYMNHGYSWEQAMELVRRNRGESSNSRVRAVSSDMGASAITSSTLATGYSPSMPPNMDPETAEIVRIQQEDHGTNMFATITPNDDPEVQRLMGMGYQYNEALLEIFNYRYPPRRQYGYGMYPPTPVGMPAQYPPQPGYPPQQQYYGGPPQGYPPQGQGQSYYVQPPAAQQAMPVMHSRSYYQVPGGSYMVMPDGSTVPVDPPEEGLYPTEMAPPRRKNSGTGSSSGGAGKPPVINGSTSLAEQRRQDAKKAAQEKERFDNQQLEREQDRSLRKKSSFLGGINGATRKSAHTEDDLVARVNHMSEVDNGKRNGADKSKVPKLKYNEADCQKLIKMGFTRDQAVQALVECHHNVDQAAHMLTENVF